MNQIEQIFESEEGKRLSEHYQSLTPEQKEQLDWAEKSFLSAEERSLLAKNSVIEWKGFKFKCAPFTLGLFADISEALGASFNQYGRQSDELKFKYALPLILAGVGPMDKMYLNGDMYSDLRNVGEEADLFTQAMNVRGAVDFFSMNYIRTGIALRKSAPDLAGKLQPKPKRVKK